MGEHRDIMEETELRTRDPAISEHGDIITDAELLKYLDGLLGEWTIDGWEAKAGAAILASHRALVAHAAASYVNNCVIEGDGLHDNPFHLVPGVGIVVGLDGWHITKRDYKAEAQALLVINKRLNAERNWLARRVENTASGCPQGKWREACAEIADDDVCVKCWIAVAEEVVKG